MTPNNAERKPQYHLGPALQSHTHHSHTICPSTLLEQKQILCKKGVCWLRNGKPKWRKGLVGLRSDAVEDLRKRFPSVNTNSHLSPWSEQLEQEARVTLGAIGQDSRAERGIKMRFAMTPFEYLHQKKIETNMSEKCEQSYIHHMSITRTKL